MELNDVNFDYKHKSSKLEFFSSLTFNKEGEVTPNKLIYKLQRFESKFLKYIYPKTQYETNYKKEYEEHGKIIKHTFDAYEIIEGSGEAPLIYSVDITQGTQEYTVDNIIEGHILVTEDFDTMIRLIDIYHKYCFNTYIALKIGFLEEYDKIEANVKNILEFRKNCIEQHITKGVTGGFVHSKAFSSKLTVPSHDSVNHIPRKQL